MRIRAFGFAFVAAGLVALLSASSATAAVYGNYSGSTVTFIDVQDQNGLFGAPTVSGDSLDFSPNAFEADCSLSIDCPPTPHTVDDTLTLGIDADPGSFIDDVVLSEAGDTTLQSFVGALAASVVTATIFVDIFEIDNVSVNNISESFSMTFSNGGNYNSGVDGYGTFIWNGGITIDIDQIIANAGLTGQATLIEINLDNTLTAFAAAGATSRIEKKDIDGLAITVVPEPGTALLMGLGLAGLASIRRERLFA